MNQNEFDALLEDIQLRTTRTLRGKGIEYASSFDRLHNFKVAGALQTCSPEAALGGMLAKHIVSVYDLIRVVDEAAIDMEKWEEKLGDAIAYFILLWALVVERNRNASDDAKHEKEPSNSWFFGAPVTIHQKPEGD